MLVFYLHWLLEDRKCWGSSDQEHGPGSGRGALALTSCDKKTEGDLGFGGPALPSESVLALGRDDIEFQS